MPVKCRNIDVTCVYVLQVLAANTNTYLVVRQELELPFVANRVRFIPYSLHTRTVCMRVELYGCSWERKSICYLCLMVIF
jgi:discoidin domain receptor family protein 2